MYLFTGRVVPQRTGFDNFTMEIGDYTGEKIFYEDKVIGSLGSDDYLSGIFKDKRTGREILAVVTYYDHQEPQRAAQNPVNCLFGGGGWSLASSRDLPADPQHGRPFKVRRLLLDKPGQQLLALYWFSSEEEL